MAIIPKLAWGLTRVVGKSCCIRMQFVPLKGDHAHMHSPNLACPELDPKHDLHSNELMHAYGLVHLCNCNVNRERSLSDW